jgi:cyanuric acid amidohydrolase
MADAGIDDAADVHFVQVNAHCSLPSGSLTLTAGCRGGDTRYLEVDGPFARRQRPRRRRRACELERSSLSEADIGVNWALWSGRGSASAGIELLNHEIVVMACRRPGPDRSRSIMQ